MRQRVSFSYTLKFVWIMTGVLAMTLLFATLGYGAEKLNSTQNSSAASDVTVELAWARPAIRGGNGAAYLVMTNNGEQPVTLIGADSPVANTVEIHQTVLMTDEELAAFHAENDAHHGHDHHHHDHHQHHDHHEHHHDHDHSDHGAADGTFVMLHLHDLTIDGGEQVLFEPAGLHIMLIDLTETLAWGSTFPITLHFLDAPSVTVSVTVGDEPEGW